MRKLCDDAYPRARNCITEHRDKLETIAKALLEYETLDGKQIRDIIEHGRMSNPPASGPASKPRNSPPPLPTRGHHDRAGLSRTG